MATISFDRRMRIQEKDVDQFISVVSAPSRPAPTLNVEKELEKGRKAVQYAFRSPSAANGSRARKMC